MTPNPNRSLASTLAATGLPWKTGVILASLPGTGITASLVYPDRVLVSARVQGNPSGAVWLVSADGKTAPEALALLAARLEALRADIDTALGALAPALPPKPAPRPTCPLCGTDADAPVVERLLLVPHTVHLPCSAVCHHTPEPGDAADRLPDFIEAHLPDAPDGSLRHAYALATLSRDYPGILNVHAAIKAAQTDK